MKVAQGNPHHDLDFGQAHCISEPRSPDHMTVDPKYKDEHYSYFLHSDIPWPVKKTDFPFIDTFGMTERQ
eukprot:6320643-Prorocentrum_lima.AAC.1